MRGDPIFTTTTSSKEQVGGAAAAVENQDQGIRQESRTVGTVVKPQAFPSDVGVAECPQERQFPSGLQIPPVRITAASVPRFLETEPDRAGIGLSTSSANEIGGQRGRVAVVDGAPFAGFQAMRTPAWERSGGGRGCVRRGCGHKQYGAPVLSGTTGE